MNNSPLAKRLQALEPGHSLTVKTHQERNNAHQIAGRYGLTIKTRVAYDGRRKSGFEIFRIK